MLLTFWSFLVIFLSNCGDFVEKLDFAIKKHVFWVIFDINFSEKVVIFWLIFDPFLGF